MRKTIIRATIDGDFTVLSIKHYIHLYEVVHVFYAGIHLELERQ